MMTLKASTWSAAGAALLLGAAVHAESPPAAGAVLRGTNCAQFMDAVDTAAGPSRAGDRKLSPEDQEAAADAQDELVITLFWVHGYQTGKTGIAAQLDQQWMAKTVARMTQVCSAKGNEKLPISEAVKQL